MGSEDRQGGKQFGALKEKQGVSLDAVNKLYLNDEHYQDNFSDLRQQLNDFKQLFMRWSFS